MDSGKVSLSKERHKHLMKKLYKIKLNKRYENTSFCDMSKFYESKLRKLRSNNVDLARNLSEQRQISQSWYEEVVNLKSDLQTTHEKLLGYQRSETGSYEYLVKNEVSRKLKEVSEPLELLVTEMQAGILGLVENFTKVKTLVCSLRTYTTDSRNSDGSNTSRNSQGFSQPPLSKTPRSPRKNIVHPMVEGHVLQPATISIPRVSLEDQRRYRLSVRQDRLNMSIIGEVTSPSTEEEAPHNSSSSSEPEDSVESESSQRLQNDDNTREQQRDLPEESPQAPSQINSAAASTTPESPKLYYPLEALNERENSTGSKEEAPTTLASLAEDPLEGPSWLYKKKGRGKKRKPKAPKKKGNQRERNYNPHLGMFSDSESELDADEDYVPPQEVKLSPHKTKVLPKQFAEEDKNPDPNCHTADEEVPFSFIQCGGRVSKRQKKSTKSRASSRCSRDKSYTPDSFKVLPIDATQSFLITDDVTFTRPLGDLKDSSHNSPEKSSSGHSSISNSPPGSTTRLSQPTEDNDFSGFSCENMELTSCVSSLPVIGVSAIPFINNGPLEPSSIDTSIENRALVTKKFFVSDSSKPIPQNLNEKTPFDISLMDCTIKIPCPFKKEIVSPKEESLFNLKDVSIVVKDIYKNPHSPEQSKPLSPNSKFDQESDNNKENFSPLAPRKRSSKQSLCPTAYPRKSSRVVRPRQLSCTNEKSPPAYRRDTKKKDQSIEKISNSLFTSPVLSSKKLLIKLEPLDRSPDKTDPENCMSSSITSETCASVKNLTIVNNSSIFLEVENVSERTGSDMPELIDLELEEIDPLALPGPRQPITRRVLDPLLNKVLPQVIDISDESKVELEKTKSSAVGSSSGRPRRCAQAISFKEPPINRKIRQGDDHTSSIYKDFVPARKSRSKKV